ncbi:hypothetical protein PF010_g29830 [Phytophthora fragariae]|uniref:Uncharacterized protein n=2 Tax=Phytophthora fragariae TaxID=53985 RepID=A0A6G0JM47_9STRA|nr:hypothetical protein PF010_g29830 [Phytophthora fragariae]
MPGHRHAGHSRRSRHSRSSRRSRRTPSPAESAYSSSERSLSPPVVETEYLRRRLLRDRKEDKTAKATRTKEKPTEPQSGKGLGVLCIYPGCTAPVMYTQSWKNHMIKAHLKTTGETYMTHHRNSYEVSVDQAVLLNDADTAKRMLMFRIGNIERSVDRLTERFETEIEAKMETVMAPLMSELYRWLSKRLDARSQSPPPRRRTHNKRRYNYDDPYSSPKVPRHSRSASVRTVFELNDDTSMEVVEEEEKAPVPTAAAEQPVQMATSTPAVTSTPAPAVASTPAAPAPVQTPMPAAPAPAPVQTPMPVAPAESTPATVADSTLSPAPTLENESEEETQLLEPAPTPKPGPHRTKKQLDAARANGVKARRNNAIKGAAGKVKINRTTKLRDQVQAKLKVATEKLEAAVAALDKASNEDHEALEAEIAKLEAEVQKMAKDLEAVKLDLVLKGAAGSAHSAVMFGKDVAQVLKDKENVVKAATKKAKAKQPPAERAATKASMEIAVSEYEAFSRLADQVDDAVEAVAVPVGEAIQTDKLTKAMVTKALEAAQVFEQFHEDFDHALLKPPQPQAARDVEL